MKQQVACFFWSNIATCLLLLLLAMSGNSQKINGIPEKNVITVASVRCLTDDPSFVRMAQCQLKPINRTLKFLSVRGVLLQSPVTQSNVELQIWKKANGYKPFIVNISLDMCSFLAGRKNLAFEWFYRILEPYSNINHTCPYSGEMIVKDVPLNNKIRMPSLMPGGNFRVDLRIYAYHVLRATIMIYTIMTDD